MRLVREPRLFFVSHAIESMFMWRIVGVTMVGLACAIGVLALMLLPDMVWVIPEGIRDHWPTGLAFACVVLHAAARRVAATEIEGKNAAFWARAGLKRVDRFSAWALQGGLYSLLSVLCAGLLLAWIPHYLTWPWARDAETFAVLAQSWDHGILPYRDIRAYNFPGATYLAWVLGKVFGWGHTVPLYAFDAACVVLMGWCMVAWSRRRLGDALPGVIGYFALVVSYLGLTYELVAQRDWYTAFLLCLGLLLMQAWPGRLTRIASALAAALALAIRPHAVLFLARAVFEAALAVDAPARAHAAGCARRGVVRGLVCSRRWLCTSCSGGNRRRPRARAAGRRLWRALQQDHAGRHGPLVRGTVRVVAEGRSPGRDLDSGFLAAQRLERDRQSLVGGVARGRCFTSRSTLCITSTCTCPSWW